MAATVGRPPSGNLPSIKCSDCGCEIEIAQIGDHVCGQEAQKPMNKFNSAFSTMRSNDRAPAPFRPHQSPAGINTSLANRPFLQPGPPTPKSGQRSPFRMPPRSATSPVFRTRSPSPDIPLSQECAFPTFPTSRPSTPSAQKRAQTDNYLQSSRGTDSRNRNRRATTSSNNTSSRPGSPASTGASSTRPTTLASESARKNSFSSVRSRPDLSSEALEVPPVPPLSEKRSQSPARSFGGLRLPFSSPQREDAPADALEPRRPSTMESQLTADSQPETGSMRRKPSQGSIHFRKPSVSAATRPLHEIGSMRSHRSTASRGGSPNKLDPEIAEPTSASTTGERNDRRLFDAPPVPGVSATQPDFERPRSRSVSMGRAERRPSNEPQPPMPLRTKALDFEVESNPYHTPSESTSSTSSAMNSSSSRSSPPTSASFLEPSRKQSDAGEARLLDNFSTPVPIPAPLNISVPQRTASPASAPATNNGQFPLPPAPTPGPASAPPVENRIEQFPRLPVEKPRSPPIETRPEQFQQPPQQRRRPAKSFSRPNYGIPPIQHINPTPPESPMDPALQGGRLPPLNTHNRFGPPSPQINSPRSAPIYRQPPTVPSIPPQQSYFPQRPQNAPQPARRATVSNKGNCRGCGEMIKGKSVSSADGRLTGRWHKHCFVCKTCREPFQTMDFYVLGNHPYCARHYHELNRSMCSKCDRGIEGQFIETDRRVKYHPHCFTCQDCHLILRDNYFEDATGKIQCEQHAYRTNHLGPGRRFPEKRSTRLMMMSEPI